MPSGSVSRRGESYVVFGSSQLVVGGELSCKAYDQKLLRVQVNIECFSILSDLSSLAASNFSTLGIEDAAELSNRDCHVVASKLIVGNGL